MKPIVLFGAGKIAEVFSACIERDEAFDIAGYTCDAAYVDETSFRGKPLLPFEEAADAFPPDQTDMLIAVGYQDCNRLRAERAKAARGKGYRLVSYISSRALLHPGVDCAENTVILDGTIVQEGSRLGDGVFLWDGALIGHHSDVGDFCWITGSAAIGSSVRMGPRCFLGLHATVGHGVTVGEACMLGAGTLLTRELAAGRVLVRRDTETHRLNSDEFFRLTQALV